MIMTMKISITVTIVMDGCDKEMFNIIIYEDDNSGDN